MIISCVKWGDKFNHEHVNRLYVMCKRNYTKDFRFICHTEDPSGILPSVEIQPLNQELDLEKWWWKLTLFNEYDWRLGRDDIHIFFDLDVVIQNNFEHFEEYAVDGKMSMVKALWKSHNLDKFDMDHNSSVMIWKGDCSYLWRKFTKDPEAHLFKYNGIDGFLYHECYDHITTIPKGQVYSRLFGVDKDNCFQYEGESPYFKEPDYTVCIFNGWNRDIKDGKYLLDDDGYKGFEHYWEKSWLKHNHTGIDRDVWLMLWRAFTENKYKTDEFLSLTQPVIQHSMLKGLWRSIWDLSKENGDVVHFLDSLSDNQWQSKKWLLDKVTDCANNISKVQLFGGWFAHPMCTLLTSALDNLVWIENTDMDEHALHVCRNINQDLSCELITTEGNVINPSDRDWDTDLVINTSSEHMPPLPVILNNRKFRKYEDHSSQGATIFAIQSNNMFHVPDHINCVKDEDELVGMCNFSKVLYKGSLDMPNGYKRFMAIGYY